MCVAYVGILFGPKRDEETGGWRKLHNEELHNLYSSPSIIRMMKSRRMRWGRRGMHIGYWWESQRERDHYLHVSRLRFDRMLTVLNGDII
jgi:hypothetical protein